MVFVCEKYYYVCRTNQINELEISKNYGKHTRFDKESTFANHKSFVASVNIPINAENDALPTLYWISNIHKNPYREGYIAGSSTCSTKELSISMTYIVPAVRGRLKAHCD